MDERGGEITLNRTMSERTHEGTSQLSLVVEGVLLEEAERMRGCP